MTTITVNSEVENSEVVIDTYHGVDVSDPFRWLEDHHSPRTRAWIDEQAADSRRYLDALPGRASLGARVDELLSQQVIAEIHLAGKTIFYTKRSAGEEQPKLYRREGLAGVEELLLDPASLAEGHSLSVSILDVSPDGKLLAYGLRKGGQGARSVHILDLESRESLPDGLPTGAVRGFNFLPQSNGFFYVIEEVGKGDHPKAAKRHFFGQSPERDKTVFYGGRSPKMRLVAGFDPKSCAAVHTVIRADAGKNLTSVYLQMLCKCGNPVMTLIEDSVHSSDVRIHFDLLYLMLDQDDGLGRKLLSVPLNAPDLSQARTILVEGSHRIQSWRIFGGRLVTTTVEDLSTELRIHTLDGEAIDGIELPEPCTAVILAGDEQGCFFSIESYTRPREMYYYDFSDNSRTLFGQSSVRLDHIAIRRLHYSAADGTVIPLTLLGREDVLSRGQAPVLLTAYGAGGVSLTPQHSFLATCFVELGGIFAIAHVRGGGERGLAWEEAGKRHNRPTVHRDFLAAAEFLGDSGIAESSRIAIAGGSNSGLLVGTAMTQRPELFCAVLCLAPILDMLRYHRFDNTQFYIPQFGSAEDPADFPVLLSYSPYHNVRDGISYPALLMTSGDADTRCDPMHARKFVARLQSTAGATSQSNRPILLDWDPARGHFATLPVATRVRGIVDRLSFLCHHLKMEMA